MLYVIFSKSMIYIVMLQCLNSLIDFKMLILVLTASFTKQGKLAQERNSRTAPMGVEISAGDLLTMHKSSPFYHALSVLCGASS